MVSNMPPKVVPFVKSVELSTSLNVPFTNTLDLDSMCNAVVDVSIYSERSRVQLHSSCKGGDCAPFQSHEAESMRGYTQINALAFEARLLNNNHNVSRYVLDASFARGISNSKICNADFHHDQDDTSYLQSSNDAPGLPPCICNLNLDQVPPQACGFVHVLIHDTPAMNGHWAFEHWFEQWNASPPGTLFLRTDNFGSLRKRVAPEDHGPIPQNVNPMVQRPTSTHGGYGWHEANEAGP